MNKFFLIICAIFSLCCSKKYGYVYDEQRRTPLENVTVIDVNNSSNIFITKADGKFSFSDCNDLIIKKNGYKTDTLEKYGCKPNGKCFDGHIFFMKNNKEE